MKTLVFGLNGQLASEFKKAYLNNKDVYQVGHQQADFKNSLAVSRLIQEIKPNRIINCSAYTAVDKAESEKDLAMQINANIMGAIGEAAKKISAQVVHYSTDYVFDGKKESGYLETDQTAPINYYGLTKQLGEKYLSETCSQHLIFRVSWVYGVYGNNFLKTMLRLGKERKELRVVCDQSGAPTSSAEICKATLRALEDKAVLDKSGLYHMSPYGKTTWHHFTEKIIEYAKQDSRFEIITENVEAITSDQFPSVAKRPEFSLLVSKKLMDTFQIELPEWNESLKFVLKGL